MRWYWEVVVRAYQTAAETLVAERRTHPLAALPGHVGYTDKSDMARPGKATLPGGRPWADIIRKRCLIRTCVGTKQIA